MLKHGRVRDSRVVVSKTERDITAYVGDRVQHKINAYEAKARCWRNWYWIMATISAVGAVLVPAFVNFESDKRITTGISLVVAIAIALERVYRPRELWRNYSLVAALLREEEMKFSTRSGPYAPDRLLIRERDGTERSINPFERFVERIEDAIHRERDETIVMRTAADSTSEEA